MKSCVVVGGGICGLFSSIILADKFDKVYLIEQDAECGGLLRSVKDDAGIYYDQGTHIPNTTNISQIDDILFGPRHQRKDRWTQLGSLLSGNYFRDEWNFETLAVDSRLLPNDLYEKGLGELMSRHELSYASDVETFLYETLGPTFSHYIVFPILRKLFGDQINISSLTTRIGNNSPLWGHNRILATTAEITNQLKQLETFDAKLAYHRRADFENQQAQDSADTPIFLYPINGKGVQYWVDHLVSLATERKVEIITSEKVSKITHVNRQITSTILEGSKQSIPCDLLFWSAPPTFALNAAGIKVTSAQVNLRTANLFHFSFDRPLLNQKSHYLWNWDEKSPIFRVTLYPNIRKKVNNKSVFSITAEVLSNKDDVDRFKSSDILQDLINMRLVSKDAICTSKYKQVIHGTFPIPTFEFKTAVEDNYSRLVSSFDNVIAAGRHGGNQFLQSDVLKSAYLMIQARCS